MVNRYPWVSVLDDYIRHSELIVIISSPSYMIEHDLVMLTHGMHLYKSKCIVMNFANVNTTPADRHEIFPSILFFAFSNICFASYYVLGRGEGHLENKGR